MDARDDPASAPGAITRLLHASSAGDRAAFSELVSLLYRELNRLAHLRLRGEATGHTLDTTGLVHEAYLRLAEQERAEWKSREQFFAVASEAMRRVLVDHARRRQRVKRGGGAPVLPLEAADDTVPIGDTQADDLLALDEALVRLAGFNPQGARVVELRFFGGLAHDEVARVLGCSERTARRSWQVARAWLRRELRHPSASAEALGMRGDT